MATITNKMRLSQFFSPDAISLELQASNRDTILEELVSLLRLSPESHTGVYEGLQRREKLASTGIGRGVAIPHCRITHVPRLRAAYGRKPEGIEFGAIDQRPVYDFFLIVAPPMDVSNDYLPLLSQLALFMKQPDLTERLAQVNTAQQFLELMDSQSA